MIIGGPARVKYQRRHFLPVLSIDIATSASILGNPAWHRALSLSERLARLRQIENITQIPMDGELAAETLAFWRAGSPFDKDSYFVDRLAMDGITEDEFTRLLGTPAEAFVNGDAPPWVQWLARTYSQPGNPLDGCRENWGEAANLPAAGFLYLVEPLMRDARLQLQAKVDAIKQAHPTAPFEPTRAVDALFANLPIRLLMMIAKTMVLELHVARLEGVLQGSTPEERFASFTQRLCRNDIALKLLSEYPVLARRLITCIENWVDYSAEFLFHLAADWKEIVSLFSPGHENMFPKCGLLAEAATGAGDTHRHGRSVLMARFEGGLELVYKPRSIAVDQHFQDLIRWVNQKGAEPQLRTLRVLTRETHGWVEFVHTAGCQSRDEVVRFYERQGEYMAILYVLQATDFHFENLLAC